MTTTTLSKKSNSLEFLNVPSSSRSNRPQSIGCDPTLNRPVLNSSELSGSLSDGVNLLSYRKIGNVRSLTSNERWHSDTNIALHPDQESSNLTVNVTEIDLEDEGNQIVIHWDIKESVSAKDWIGLYRTDETHPGRWLDYRNRGVSGTKRGELVWSLDRIVSQFVRPETKVCFRYYHGNSGDLRAVTNSITVRNPQVQNVVDGTSRSFSVESHTDADVIHLALQDLEAVHVRKGMFFNPDPYVKIRIEPGSRDAQPILNHHFKETRTSVRENTTEPAWHDEVFHFTALPNDNLFMKVKDRFTSSRPTLLRFLGQISVPVKQVIEKAKLGLTMSCPLMGRTPHDHVSGHLLFKPSIIPYDADRIMVNGHCTKIRPSLDSTIERMLERASTGVYDDSTPSNSDTDSDLDAANRPKVRQLVHTNSGTSGDSSVADGNQSVNSLEQHDSSSSPNVEESVNTCIYDSPPVIFTANEIEDETVESPTSDMSNSYDLNTSLNTLTSSVNDLHSPALSRSSTPDMLTAYQTEVELTTPLGELQALSSSRPNNEDSVGDDLATELQEVARTPEQEKTTDTSEDLSKKEAGVENEPQTESKKKDVQENPVSSLAASSSSVWSLENQVGSCESSPRANQAEQHDIAEDISIYLNRSNVAPPSPSGEPCLNKQVEGNQKPPLPQPRLKTLAEQLENLHIIESSIDPNLLPHKPPELPRKTRLAKPKSPPSAETSNDSRIQSSTKPKRLESGESLDMPSDPPPPPPTGARPKKPIAANQHYDIAQDYGALDAPDGFFKRNKSDKPPELKPRKGKQPANNNPPPELPPRRAKAEHPNGVAGDAGLDDVFEPGVSHSHIRHKRHHHHHHLQQTPGVGAGSEEARVAAEVANAAASLPRPHHMKSESIEVEEALPAGWEARVDTHGRIFYIDHNNKVTTWSRPTTTKKGQPVLQRVPSISNTDRRNMDHRYRNIQRMASVDTISERALSPPRHHAPPPPASSALPAPSLPAADSNHQPPPPPPPPPTPPPETSSSSQQTNQTSNSSEGAASSSSGQSRSQNANSQHNQEVIRSSPAVKFLTRTDFFSLVQYSDEAQVAYTSNSALKHMVHRIRKDPMTFLKYWHNKDLVNFLNMFVNKEEVLPENWQMKYDKSGKVFFLDHTTKTTTFIDPRLPIHQPPLNPGQIVPLPRGRYRTDETSADLTSSDEPSSSDLVPTAYNEKVVLFLRQPNVMQLLQDKYPPLKKNESLRHRINTIIADGTQALRKYRNHVELTIILSMFENEIMSFVPAHLKSQADHTSPKGSPVPGRRQMAPPYKRDFQEKYRTFLKKLETKGIGQGPGKIKMRVRRDHILEDSFKKVMSYSKRELQRNKLLISFLGEEGLDYGGPAREFFFLLSRELFNPYYGLFEYSANDTYTVQISAMSTFVDNASEWFRFAGRMIGLCIVHQYLMDAFFTRPFYKMLLREPCVLSDLESLDAEFHQSLLWVKENDITDAGLDLTFSVDEEVFGQVIERELKPNGMNISVTNKNKKEYVDKMVSWRIERGVHEQKDHILRGVYEVIEPKLVSMFDAKDLELVIAGTAEIDVTDWRNNTEYRSGYYDTHPVVDWFWEVMEIFDNEKRLRLLQFVTGTSSIPFEGFAALRGSNGPRKFTIEKWGNPESLPRAHTCFNRLDLPAYTSKETMQEKLLLAISETSTFGIE